MLVKKNFKSRQGGAGCPWSSGFPASMSHETLFFMNMQGIIPLDIFVYADIFIFMKTTAQIFKALSDETRLRIMALLLRGEELCVCDIMAALDLPQSTVSRHLSYLRNAGLVEDRRQGIWMHYTVNREKIEHGEALCDLLVEILHGKEQNSRDQVLLKVHLAAKEIARCG